MDPFSALSIATAVLQFVEFSTKLLSGAREIYYSTTGSTVDNAALELIVKEIEAWPSRLRTSRVSNARVTEEDALHRLAAECEILSRELFQLIRRNIPSDPKPKCAALCAAFKDKLHDKEKQQLLERVKECRQQLTVQLETLDRSNFTLPHRSNWY
ncbi:hypothetical protein ETB97_005905 [Aspergillus alliaceus]|uniref:Uncharacterized protein n=1 Tax=Petromyces alliaceus TaxID=209559 RepID=A0A8H6E3V1_PETAA|nr:hypothetical protein ETB97_005905 [Aspergillus burnettii]